MIDLEKMWLVCPKCGHDWIAHFQMVDTDGNLITPTPRPCMECAAPGCGHAQEEEKRRKTGGQVDEEENDMILDAMSKEPEPKEERGPRSKQLSLF